MIEIHPHWDAEKATWIMDDTRQCIALAEHRAEWLEAQARAAWRQVEDYRRLLKSQEALFSNPDLKRGGA